VAPFSSAAEAIATFPETATAVAVRLERTGSIEVLAPHGLGRFTRLKPAPSDGLAREGTKRPEESYLALLTDPWVVSEAIRERTPPDS
jgi:hypothetical protein